MRDIFIPFRNLAKLLQETSQSVGNKPRSDPCKKCIVFSRATATISVEISRGDNCSTRNPVGYSKQSFKNS